MNTPPQQPTQSPGFQQQPAQEQSASAYGTALKLPGTPPGLPPGPAGVGGLLRPSPSASRPAATQSQPAPGVSSAAGKSPQPAAQTQRQPAQLPQPTAGFVAGGSAPTTPQQPRTASTFTPSPSRGQSANSTFGGGFIMGDGRSTYERQRETPAGRVRRDGLSLRALGGRRSRRGWLPQPRENPRRPSRRPSGKLVVDQVPHSRQVFGREKRR